MEAQTTEEDNKSECDDSGNMELDTTNTSSSPPSTTNRIRSRDNHRRRMQNVFPRQATFDRSSVSMVRKIVKKAIKTRQRMENNQHRRNRQRQLLEQLSHDSLEELNQDDRKKQDFEEPPPRPPTRRCMFYRDEPEVKVLRAKQI